MPVKQWREGVSGMKISIYEAETIGQDGQRVENGATAKEKQSNGSLCTRGATSIVDTGMDVQVPRVIFERIVTSMHVTEATEMDGVWGERSAEEETGSNVFRLLLYLSLRLDFDRKC
jgi:hypothetical protein